MPKFSIIVPIYNVEKYLNKCIDSVLAQSFSDFELILVDDGSPDNCPAMCDEYAKKDGRIKVVHKENGGLSSARNVGLDVVSGEFVWFVDSDDCISHDALEKIEKYTDDVDIVNFGLVCYKEGQEVDFNEKRDRFRKYHGTADKKTICELATHACSTKLLPYVWRNIYRLEFLNQNGLRFTDGLSYAEDSAFNMEAFMKAEKMYFADEYIYGYCMRESGISKNRSKTFDKTLLGHFELYDEIRDSSYEKYCEYPDEQYYKDAGEFTIKTIYVYSLLNRLYTSESKNDYFLFKKISKSKMLKKAFARFDINELKSKSLEWKLFWFVKKRMYLLAFIIYRFFIF